MKKFLWGIAFGAVLLAAGTFLLGRYVFPNNTLSSLPKPELSEGERGQLGIDKNINESTIDNYLGRSDAVYRDVRMLKDPGNYEAIGGDSYLSGFVDGFEVVPLPYLVNVTGLPEAVGNTYNGKTLFTNKNGKYVANYKESTDILEDLFPKDKVIFLMCGGGGYSGILKQMLVSLGWDEDKIYDVGGYWFYKGENNVRVKRELVDGNAVYDFYKVPYHEIDFSGLTKCDGECKPEYVGLNATLYDRKVEDKESFVVMVDQNGCTTADKVRQFVLDWAGERRTKVYRIMFEEVKKSKLYNSVEYYPSVAVVKNGEPVAWLKADSDADADAYNDYDSFKNWINNFA